MEFSGQYLNYFEYKELGGTLSEMPFNLLEFKARKEIDKYTFGRLTKLPLQTKEVKLCILELIEVLNSYESEESQNKAVASESTDGYSVTYQAVTREQIKVKNDEIKSIIYTYLNDSKLPNGTPYLYRGL